MADLYVSAVVARTGVSLIGSDGPAWTAKSWPCSTDYSQQRYPDRLLCSFDCVRASCHFINIATLGKKIPTNPKHDSNISMRTVVCLGLVYMTERYAVTDNAAEIRMLERKRCPSMTINLEMHVLRDDLEMISILTSQHSLAVISHSVAVHISVLGMESRTTAAHGELLSLHHRNANL